MAALDKLLRGAPGKLVILSGPMESGKSAILAEFRRRQCQGLYPGASCIADAGLWISYPSRCGEVTSFHDNGTALPKVLEAELEQVQKAEDMDSFQSAVRQLGRRALEGGYAAGLPTIIIDEANRLRNWATDDAGRKNLEQLLTFLAKVTKDEGIVNVVLENFFGEWIEKSVHHKTAVVNVGDLPEKEARAYFDKLIAPRVVADEVWRDIFHHLGGRMGLLVHVAGLTDEWDEFKLALGSNFRRDLLRGLKPLAIDASRLNKPSLPKWSTCDWVRVMRALVSEDGAVSYAWLCGELSQEKVDSMVEYDLVHYRPWDTRDILACPAESYPLILPGCRFHLREMEKLLPSL